MPRAVQYLFLALVMGVAVVITAGGHGAWTWIAWIAAAIAWTLVLNRQSS